MIAALTVAGVLLLAASTHAQSQPAFEAASIKSSKGDMDQFRVSAGGIDVRDFTLGALIQTAYGVQSFQISGGPAWLESDRFNIVARSTGAPSRQQTNLMLQTLLAERFHLALHRETKELPVYHLIPAKSGSKLTPAPADPRPGDGDFHWGLGRIQGQSVTLEPAKGPVEVLVIDRVEKPSEN